MPVGRFVRELRRRRVFRTAGLYVVGAWMLMQVADVFFPGWGLPDSAINLLLMAAVLGFPLALVFGWLYELTPQGVVRTPPAGEPDADAPLALQRRDYLILGALGIVAAFIVYDATRDIVATPRVDEHAAGGFEDFEPLEKLPNSVAVLPFANITNDPDNEVFCDGVSEEILNRLGAFTGLNIIGRTSSFALRGSDFQIPKISSLLGARYLVQGSVRRQGDRLRISAQLLDETGAQRWANTFDRTLEDVFAIQSEIAEIVASTVVPQIVSPKPAYAPSIDAYQHYLAGRELLRRRVDVKTRARAQLEQAIELDPRYAAAYAELAVTYGMGAVGADDAEAARHAIDKALGLEPDMPRALAARGLLLSQQPDPDMAGAEAALRAALDKDPNMVDAMNWLGNVLVARGDRAGADALTERAARIDPLNGAIALSVASRYAARGDFDRAELLLLRLWEMPEPGQYPLLGLRSLYWNTGRIADMNGLERRAALRVRHHYFGMALSYALVGLWEEASYWADRTTEDYDSIWSETAPAWVPGWQGRYDEAVAVYDGMVAEAGRPIGQWPKAFRLVYGGAQAMAGDFAGALRTLETVIEPGEPASLAFPTFTWDGLHALVWSYRQTGAPERAEALLKGFERILRDFRREGLLHESDKLYFFARNALLLGDRELAFDRLEQAIDAGWREYYIRRHDPFWASVSDDPRYQALMAAVKADADTQRPEIERRDAAEDFPARLDAARAAEDGIAGAE